MHLLKFFCHSIVFAKRSVESGVFNHPWTFRSYDNFSAQTENHTGSPMNPGRGTNLAAWKVARAATAAHLYFKPLEIALDDGEVIRTRKQNTQLSQMSKENPSARHANPKKNKKNTKKKLSKTSHTALLSDAGFSKINNPSVNVLDELSQVFREGPKKVANWVSIGTARQISPHGISTLTSVLKSATAEMGDPEGEHQRMEQFRRNDFEYYRLNDPDGLADVDMDDWKPRRSKDSGAETIEEMEAAFNRWVRDLGNQDTVQKAATRLVQIRRERTKEYSRWERFALGRLFICPANDCFLDSDETWHYRDSFAHHLREEHRYNDADIQEAIRNSHRDWQYKARVR